MRKIFKTPLKEVFAVKINVKKAANIVTIASWLQIIAAIVLAVLYFMGYSVSTTIMIVVLVPVVIFGNAMLMRNSWNILSFREQLNYMEETIEGEAELNKMLRVQRHDFINHLQVVHSLIQLEEYEESADYIKEVYEEIRDVGSVLRTSNPAMNALLAAKKATADNIGIELEYHISARLESIALEDWEICRIFSNLLDNAFYAAKEHDKNVHLSLREDINATYFSIENSGEIPLNIREKIFEPGFTTKGNLGTGMGLFIVRDTLLKCKGNINVDVDDGITRFYGFIPVANVTNIDI